MATVLEDLDAANAKATAIGGAVADLATAFTALASDVNAALAAAANPSVDEQAALDQLNATLDSTTAQASAALAAIQAENATVGDADGDGNPPPPAP